jgi:hypothetical protein
VKVDFGSYCYRIWKGIYGRRITGEGSMVCVIVE